MVFNTVCESIHRHVDIAIEDITMESNITSDLGADSLALLDILMDLEEAYDVDIPEKKIGTTVGSFVEFIEARMPVEVVESSVAAEPVDTRESA